MLVHIFSQVFFEHTRFESNYSSCTGKSSENISRRTEGAFSKKEKQDET
jgi:hypothetical protein